MTVENWNLKSPGHVGYVGDYEYATVPQGDLGRAWRGAPLGSNGYRLGLRFEWPAGRDHKAYVEYKAGRRSTPWPDQP